MGSSLLLKGGTSTPRSIVESFSLANSFSEGDAIRYDIPSGTWVKAQADSAENSEVAGVVSAASFNTFDLTYSGYINLSVLSGVSAPVLFLDSTTAGGLTSSPPSAIGSVIKPVLTKITNGSGYIVTNYLGTQIGGSSTVAIDEIQPVGTVVPFAGSVIPDSWLECNGNSYAVGAYPYLYSKLQYSSGDRVPAYGHVAVLTTQTPVPPSSIGRFIRQGSTDATTVRAKIIAIAGTTITVQTVPVYSPGNKNFVVNNTVFTTGLAQDDEDPFTIISAVSITHFNTPDLRGRVALGVNTGAITDTDDDSTVNTTNSAISGIYSLGSAGGQESTVANTGVGAGSAAFVTSATTTGGLLPNLPPYTVVRYIIKASPYTRAAIIDGIDIPYTSLLVGDLRDGTLRPGGSGEPLVFKTNDGTSGVEQMRLTNDGKLGIGTTTPQHTFVVSQGNDTLEFQPGHQTDVSFIQALNRTTNLFTTTLDFRAKDYIFRSGSLQGTSITMNSSGGMNIPATTDSTTTTTGGLTLGGGAGIAKNLTVGGGISAAGGITFSGLTRVTNDTTATSPTVAAFTVVGGIGAKGLHVGTDGQSIAGTLNVTGETRVDSAAASSSTITGALRVLGGVGIQGALYVGGITTAGGISMGGALTVGGGITAARLDLGTGVMKSGSILTGSFSATTLGASGGNQSSSVSSGDLVVVGGAGIGKNLYVGGGITAAGSLDLGSGAINTTGTINSGNILSTGTFQAKSLNASFNTTSTSTGSGSLVVAGGAGIAGTLNVGLGISAGGGITSAGNLNLGSPRNYTSTSSYGNMIRVIGVHNNTKIQLVASGQGTNFGQNGNTAGAALLMWASEPNATLYGSGIGANLNASPGSEAETRQFTGQAQAFVRFNSPEGSIGLHTSAVGATASLNPHVSVASNGVVNASAIIASTNITSGTLVVAGGAGIAGALHVGGGITAARLDVGSGGMKLIGGGFTASTFVNITDTSTSTSTGSGALRVAGGAGIGGALNVGATASFAANVGIGTTNPNSLLNISQGSPVLNLENTTATENTGAVLRFGHNQSSDRRPVAEIKTLLTDGSASRSGHLTISTSLSGTLTERMRIESGGNVGIGGSVGIGTTTLTNAKLEIVGSTIAQSEALRLSAGTSSQVGLRLYEDSDHPDFLRIRPISATQKGFIFSNNGDTTVLTVDSANNRVGIGISGPTQALDVVGSITASAALRVGGGISAGGGITSGGSLSVGDPRNYTASSAGHSSSYMMRALGSHTNTKIQLVSTGNSETFGGNADTDGSSLLIWASEPSLTYSGSGIGSNMTCSPLATDNRQFTGQGQAFIRFTADGSMGFHTAPVGTLILPTTPRVSISPAGALNAGALNAGALNVSGVGAFTRISAWDGASDLNSSYRISAKAPPGTDNKGALLGYSNDQLTYGLVGFNNLYSFYGEGKIYTNGTIQGTSTMTPGAWVNGAAPKSYIGTAAPILANFPISGSIWFVV
jgi:hypothetical protein